MKRIHLKNNGFSMVELIIVIAIMAIIASVLAPQLIKYINKARLSRDIDSGKVLATSIMAVIADGGDYEDAAVAHATPYPYDDMDSAGFKQKVDEVIGGNGIVGKSVKDMDGDPLDGKFYYTLDPEKNKVAVYYGGTTDDHQIYPNLGRKLTDKY